ncbi:MAG: hypothetical protein Q8928_10990 [Bacteroidota bacterium]|nr:hypothetical protein [Bacteroidota bacterium]
MKLPFLRILAALLLIWTSCEKESYYTSSDAVLKFSCDTIAFDTVFTSIGTATQRLMVYNPYNKILKISSIQLAGGDKSPYILNINGVMANNAADIEVYPNDSLYIFVQVLINPTGNDLPLLVRDSVIFNVNGNLSSIKLQAYGQDVHLVKGGTIKSQTWTADKPYLIYGDLTLDTLQSLVIDKGTKVYFHKNANLRIKGSLNVNGEFGSPVTFGGDRLESDYNDIPGQWGGILLMPGSVNNTLNYVVIKNGTSGLQVGTVGNLFQTDLVLSNSIIQNMAYNCLLANNSKIKVVNTVLADGGAYTCALWGGSYEFYHSTIVNYSGSYTSVSRYPVLYLSNYVVNSYETVIQPLIMVGFYNTIVYGNYSDEIAIDFKPTAPFNYKFDHCLLKGDAGKFTSQSQIAPIWNKSPRFKAVDKMVFELDTLSPAKDAGNKQVGNAYPFDIKMINRTTDLGPDLGAYERVEK